MSEKQITKKQAETAGARSSLVLDTESHLIRAW